MQLLSIVHEDDAGPGVFSAAAEQTGFDVTTWVPGRGELPDVHDFEAVWTFGGSMHPDQDADHPWLVEERDLLIHAIDHKKPILGVCLGAQVLASAAGSTPRPAARPEIGWKRVEVTAEGEADPLLGPLAPAFDAFEWHSYEIPLPDGAIELARNDLCLQAFRIDPLVWGIQFHAEVTQTDALGWIRDYGNDDAAKEAGIDKEGFVEETEAKIAAWNEIGRTIALAFLSISTLALRRPG
jgi:GMP synthase (glutamine-hydrolysing)